MTTIPLPISTVLNVLISKIPTLCCRLLLLCFMVLGGCLSLYAQPVDTIQNPSPVAVDTARKVTLATEHGSPTDSTNRKKMVDIHRRRHSPLTATLLSTFVPGAGQIYNRKYFKAPIAWAALGGMTYLAIHNGGIYQDFRKAYLYRVDDDPNTTDTKYSAYSDYQVKSARDAAQRNFEYTIMGLVAIHLLNVIDAFVDAHLFYYDINDNLNVSVSPKIIPEFTIGKNATINQYLGISISITARQRALHRLPILF